MFCFILLCFLKSEAWPLSYPRGLEQPLHPLWKSGGVGGEIGPGAPQGQDIAIGALQGRGLAAAPSRGQEQDPEESRDRA